jgi:STAS domain
VAGMGLGMGDGQPCLTLPVPLRPADVPALCRDARDLMQGGLVRPLECDVASLDAPDLVAVEALARIELTARRLGSSLRLRGPSVELLELLALCGLPLAVVLEPEREAEHREEARGVQEERDPGDPVA